MWLAPPLSLFRFLFLVELSSILHCLGRESGNYSGELINPILECLSDADSRVNVLFQECSPYLTHFSYDKEHNDIAKTLKVPLSFSLLSLLFSIDYFFPRTYPTMMMRSSETLLYVNSLYLFTMLQLKLIDEYIT